MKDEEKLDVFREYLDLVQTPQINEFTQFILLRLPEYFWTLPASTTGKNHGADETLLDHVLACLYMAKQVNNQFENHWTQRQKDQLYSSLMLHDGWRCGEPGNECRITQEMIDEKKLDQKLLGNLKTAREHAEVGYRQLLQLVAEYNRDAARNGYNQIGGNNYSMILKAVRFHYGPWTQGSDKSFSLSWPYDSVVMQCHNIDFHQCHNQMYLTRGNVNHTVTCTNGWHTWPAPGVEKCPTCQSKIHQITNT